MKQNLTRKQIIIRFFRVTGMIGQNRHNWPDFFLFKKAVLVLKK